MVPTVNNFNISWRIVSVVTGGQIKISNDDISGASHSTGFKKIQGK